MGGALVIGGLIAALIAFLLREEERRKALGSGQQGPVSKGLKNVPVSVKGVLMRGDDVTRTELEVAASSASIAGYPMLANALLKKADTAKDAHGKSPLESVSPAAWRKFETLMRRADWNSDGKRIGAYQFSLRRLGDFDIVKDTKRNKDGVWHGTWMVPKEKFLGDPMFQTRLFGQSMASYKRLIKERYPSAIGTSFEGQPATLSGLLAVAHLTGIDGLGKWLANKPPRAKFVATNTAYKAANGLF